MGMTHSLIHILIKWLDLLALTPLVGIFICNLFMPSPSSPKQLYPSQGTLPIRLSILILGMTTLAELIVRAMMMSGRPFFALHLVIPSVITRTYFGPVLALRFSLVVLLGFILMTQKESAVKKWIDGMLLAALCLTTSLLGHAGGQGTFTMHVLIDTLHLIAISAWIGGLFFLIFNLPKQLASEGDKTLFLTDAIARFSTIATTSVGILIVTGIGNSFFQINSPGLLLHTAYGKVLLLKWGFLLPMLLLGFTNKYIVLPKFQEHCKRKKANRLIDTILKYARVSNTPFDLSNLFFRLIKTEAVLGVAILLLTACLTQLSPPPRHLP
ncbi:MAG: CopD family protein [Nitrospirae bacterium]|nr:CopD family protein [Candidatus Troglogloeales bacterium]